MLMVVEGLQALAYTVPTPEPETDGTLEWDATTIVVVEARAGGHAGVGYTSQGARPGRRARRPSRQRPRRRCGLWQRRLHLAVRPRLGRSARRLGRSGHAAGKAQGGGASRRAIPT